MIFKYKFLKKRLIDANLSIENINFEDIQKIRKWRNDQVKGLRQNKRLSITEQTKYFRNYIMSQSKLSRPETFLFGLKKDNNLIGYGGLVYISWTNRRAEISFLLDTKIMKTKGKNNFFFLRYFDLIKFLAFNKLKLLKIYMGTSVFRNITPKLLKKSGFKYEATLKKHVYKKTIGFVDVAIYSYFNKLKR
tara:strand:- start:1144 stop:1716 length:573 start_codon:yes stop_codon:yes gene_type:complete